MLQSFPETDTCVTGYTGFITTTVPIKVLDVAFAMTDYMNLGTMLFKPASLNPKTALCTQVLCSTQKVNQWQCETFVVKNGNATSNNAFADTVTV